MRRTWIYACLVCCAGFFAGCRENRDEPYENPPMEENDRLPEDGLMNGHHPDSIHMERGRGSND